MPQTNADNLLAIGQQIAGCRVVQFLGAGGMGQVYKCEHLRLQKPVALKILPVLDSASIKRFLREARSAAKIDHPNVVTIHDVDQDPATKLYFIIMQLINGRNLAELVTANGRAIPWRQALKLIRGAAKGAGAVHAMGLVHRDIKPANVMLSTTTRQAILMDFGLVREIERTEQLTVGSAGTPMFMSPEQCQGADDLDGRSDIVSLGRTLYYLLTARLPYTRTAQGKNGTLDIMNQIVSGRLPPPVHTLNPAAPVEVSQLVERAMAHRRERRFQDTTELVAAIDRLSKLPDPPSTANYVSSASDPGTETINDLPELELITDGSADDRPIPRKWLVAGGIVGVCVVALLAWILNRPSRGDDASKQAVAEGMPDTSKMIRIPAGKVNLGNPEAALRKHAGDVGLNGATLNSFLNPAAPRKEAWVDVPAFYIDKYEVTEKEYARFVHETKRTPPKDWVNGAPPVGFENDPVVFVSHADATAYAAWAKKKLPTEAQWLRAFRGDKTTLYPWGDTWEPARTNVFENPARGHRATCAVTATPRDVTPLGVFNMVGNVDEILRDHEIINGRPWVVLRGANWDVSGAMYGTAAFPIVCDASKEIDDRTGFRCVYEEP